MVWNEPNKQNGQYTWCLRFPTVAEFQRFRGKYEQCLWEIKNEMPLSKAPAADQQYATRSWEDVEMKYVGDDDTDEEDISAALSEVEGNHFPWVPTNATSN